MVTYRAGNSITGTNTQRGNLTTTNLQPNLRFFETDTEDMYQWDGDSWNLIVGNTIAETFSNKTLTSPVLNTGISGSAIKDEDNMASDSATHVATQQSIKAYVDATSGTVTVTDNENTNEDNLITFVAGAATSTGTHGLEMDGDLKYNPSTGRLTATQLSGTLQTAAQTNITSVGALGGGSISSGFGVINNGASAITTTGLISGGSLDIDDVLINGSAIGHTDDTDLITLADGLVTIAGEVSVTTLDIGGTNVTSTAAEINLLDALDRGSILYGNASGATAVLGQGSASTVLTSDGTDIAWAAIPDASTITISANNSTDETVYPIFVDGSTGSQGLETDTGLTYNPSTGVLTSTTFTGALSGNATTATGVAVTDNESTNENNLIAFVADAATSTGNHGLEMDGNLYYNPSTGTVTATAFAGSLTGNATTATALATARTIGGVSFDGSANINLPGVNASGNQNTSGNATTATTATNSTNVTVTDNEDTNENDLIPFVANAGTSTGNHGLEMDGDFHYNPSTGRLTATQLAGTIQTASQTNITAVGALNAGSITSGFTSIDVGSGAITTTGTITAGNLTVNGTTTTVNSTTVTVDDPIFTIGGDSAPGSDDNKDRGIEFRWHNGSAAKVGFFGFDDSAGKFTFIPDATNSSEVFSGTAGTIVAALEGNASTATALATARTIGGVSFDGSANINLPGVNAAGNQDTSGTATLATNVTATANNTANETVYLTFVDGVSGSQGIETDSGLTYNPSTGNLTATTFNGTMEGTATSAAKVTVTDNESTNENDLIPFVENAGASTGVHGLEMDGDFHYNPSSGTVTATTFSGALSGNASTATALANARTIGGVSFDGSANINLPGVNATGDQDTSGTAALATEFTATANNTANETVYPVFVDGVSGAQGAETDSGLTYNPSSGVLTATQFTGAVSGNATTATTLATARTIGGTSFDGSANISVALSTEATNVTASANNSTDETVYPTFVDGATGTQGIETDTGLTYNPSSGILTATQFTGAVSGNSTTATTATNVTASANNSTDETVYPTFVDGATGAQGIETDTGLTYNPSTGVLTSTQFTGAVSGNASTATALATARNITIAGDVTASAQSFDGTGNITLTTSFASGVIVNADVNASAAIADSKLATISTANKVGLAALDVDGGTDIGEALHDDDLFIVDNGAGGTNRKMTASRIKTYIGDSASEGFAIAMSVAL